MAKWPVIESQISHCQAHAALDSHAFLTSTQKISCSIAQPMIYVCSCLCSWTLSVL